MEYNDYSLNSSAKSQLIFNNKTVDEGWELVYYCGDPIGTTLLEEPNISITCSDNKNENGVETMEDLKENVKEKVTNVKEIEWGVHTNSMESIHKIDAGANFTKSSQS